MKSFFIDPAEAACGAIFIGFGAFFALQSFGLDIGTAFRMGPGYFPLVLAIVLILLGGVIFIRATRVQGDALGAIAWRGIFSSCLRRSFSVSRSGGLVSYRRFFSAPLSQPSPRTR